MALGFIFTVAIVYQKSIDNIEVTLPQLVRLIVLLAIITLLPLLMAFTFYFALWHSILSVRNIFSYFKSFNNDKKFAIICNKSILFSLLALGGMFMIFFVLNYFLPDMNMLFALLIILSVLTLPHLQVMHRMYQNLNIKNNSLPVLITP